MGVLAQQGCAAGATALAYSPDRYACVPSIRAEAKST